MLRLQQLCIKQANFASKTLGPCRGTRAWRWACRKVCAGVPAGIIAPAESPLHLHRDKWRRSSTCSNASRAAYGRAPAAAVATPTAGAAHARSCPDCCRPVAAAGACAGSHPGRVAVSGGAGDAGKSSPVLKLALLRICPPHSVCKLVFNFSKLGVQTSWYHGSQRKGLVSGIEQAQSGACATCMPVALSLARARADGRCGRGDGAGWAVGRPACGRLPCSRARAHGARDVRAGRARGHAPPAYHVAAGGERLRLYKRKKREFFKAVRFLPTMSAR